MTTLRQILIACAILAILVPGVMAADVTTLDPGNGTDWNLWILSGLLGAILFLASLRIPGSAGEVEIDAIISVMAWIPIAFCAWSSFQVNRYISPGVVTIYSQSEIGMLMVVFLIIALGNTFRLIALHQVFRGEERQERIE